jgi:hypothetical protein
MTKLAGVGRISPRDRSDRDAGPGRSTTIGQRSLDPAAATAVDAVLAGGGQAMDPLTRNAMQRRFRHDFSSVRVYVGNESAAANRALNSQAFTLGQHIVFGQDQYAPHRPAGRALLAHELAHVVQTTATDSARFSVGDGNSAWETEAANVARRVMAGNPVPPIRQRAPSIIHRNGGPIISGSEVPVADGPGSESEQPDTAPTAATPPEPFVEGRPAHDHPASPEDWALVQADARDRCFSTSPTVIDCICATGSPAVVFAAASAGTLTGAAQTHFDHYESGGGADLDVSATLSRMLHSDAGARGVLAEEIASRDRGHVFIQQPHYSEPEFKNAFGGIDRVDFLVERDEGRVHVWFKDRYDFHPVGYGYEDKGAGDVMRNTNCVHAAAVELKSSGAADFWMYAYSVESLSLFEGSAGGGGGGSID